jgi:aspartate 1-decarboxylase
MLKSKIHRATLTGTELDYEGSITIDRLLLDAAEMIPNEQVHVLNVSNGHRLVTYIIEGEAGSGTIMLNGPAARDGIPGDQLIVLTYCALDADEAARHRPIVVKVDEKNRLR